MLEKLITEEVTMGDVNFVRTLFYGVFAILVFMAWELYTSLHHQQHIVFMRISKKTISVLEVAFSILIVVPF